MKFFKYALISTVMLSSTIGASVMSEHIRIARGCLDSLKVCIVEFLDRDSQLKLKDHAILLEELIDRLDNLILKVKLSYEYDEKKKYLIHLKILKPLKKDVQELHDIFNTSYFFFVTFIMAARRVLSKLTSDKYQRDLTCSVDELRKKLEINEIKELNKLMATLLAIQKLVPTNKFTAIAILRNVWNR